MQVASILLGWLPILVTWGTPVVRIMEWMDMSLLFFYYKLLFCRIFKPTLDATNTLQEARNSPEKGGDDKKVTHRSALVLLLLRSHLRPCLRGRRHSCGILKMSLTKGRGVLYVGSASCTCNCERRGKGILLFPEAPFFPSWKLLPKYVRASFIQ